MNLQHIKKQLRRIIGFTILLICFTGVIFYACDFTYQNNMYDKIVSIATLLIGMVFFLTGVFLSRK